MKKQFIYIISILVLSCCKENNRSQAKLEYYLNGKIKSKTTIVDGKKTVHNFFENNENVVKSIITEVNDTLSHAMYYDLAHNLKEEGDFYLDSLKIGKWKIYDTIGRASDVRDYILIENNSYLNQRWVMNQDNDTIGGNYFLVKMKDTIDFGEVNRIYFLLKQPLFSEDSEAFVLLPKDGQNLENDFSNQNEIEWDTIFSLGTKFESNQDLKFRNHDIVFDAYSKDKGKMNLKGILVEKEPGGDESVDFKTRNIYFDIPYFVK